MCYDVNYLKEHVNQIYDDTVSFRRMLHINPELSEHEEETAAAICRKLDSLGIRYTSGIAGNGISAVIYGKDPCWGVAIRADMDALPLTEKADIPFKSANAGVMHACGHDIHTAILLGTAQVLNNMRDCLPGSVRLLFQPSEETIGGAQQMIEAGCLESPRINSVIGLHVDTDTDAGDVEFITGYMNAASAEFFVTVIGKSCHGAHPTDGIDALLPACAMVTGLQSVITRRIPSTESVLITVGMFTSGCKGNIISGEAKFSGIIRCADMSNIPLVKDYIRSMCISTAKAYGATCHVSFRDSYPSLKNDDTLLNWVAESSRRILGAEHVKISNKTSLGTDDFACFCNYGRGLYYNLGVRRPGEKNPYPIHSNYFNPDEECIRTGILTETAAVLKILNEEILK